MKVSKKVLVDGKLVGEKLTDDGKLIQKKRTAKLKEKMGAKLGEKMGIDVEYADQGDPFAQGQYMRQKTAEAAQTGSDDTGATTTADTTEAVAACRISNRNEFQLNFNLFGDLTWMAGQVIFADSTCGQFSRRYFLTKVTHRIFSKGSGYSVNVEGRGCLDY
jgi:hypothetical protein